jgi:hypothetical protein
MPNIAQFDAGNLQLHPSETGVEATARAGLRMGQYGNQIAQALQTTGERIGRVLGRAGEGVGAYMENREISMGAANGASMIATLNEDWNNTAKNADPNDPTLAAKWRTETLEPKLEAFHDSFTTEGGQKWAEHFVDQYREHSVVKTAADMSSLAADAVHVNVEKLKNGLSTAAFNDPSTLDFVRDTLAHSLDGIIASSPNISATDAAKAKTELTQKYEESIVKSAVMGAIVKGGNWQAIANDPKNAPYVNAPEIQQFERAEKTYQHMDAAAAKTEAANQRETARINFNGKANELELATIPQQAGGRPMLPADYWDKVKELGTMPGASLEPGRLRTMIENGEALTARLGKGEPNTDPAIYDHLMKGFFDPMRPTTMTDIIQNEDHLGDHAMHRLTETYNLLKNEDLNDPVFKQTMAGAKEMIEQKVGGVNLAAGKYAAFVQTFLPQYMAQKRAGTLPPNALDMNDPKSLISQSMQQYLGPLSKSLNNQVKANGGVGAPPSPPVYVAPKGAPQVKTRDEYDKLAPGTTFIGSDGKPYTKPKTNVTTLAPGQM